MARNIMQHAHVSYSRFSQNQPEAGDYSYSGMHDHGPLPAPKEGGDIAQLIGCVEATKRFSDEFLTDVIKKEKAHHPSPKQGGNPKRPKKTS